MKLDHQKLHTDILVRLNEKKMYQRDFAADLDFSQEVFQGIRKKNDMRLSNYLKIVEWLEKPMDYYITKDKNR